jgi:uncharacterized metal-binding protein
MDETERKVVVLPCSGIGKVYGALAREAAYELVENVRPGVTKLTCLPLLIVKDSEATALVTENPVITIDGCPKQCARKSVEAAGGEVTSAHQTIEFYKEHRNLKPQGVAEVDQIGRTLAGIAAHDMAAEVDELLAEVEEEA